MSVQRYSRGTRWFHAAVYVTVLVLLGTGWWFIVDRYRHGSAIVGTVHEYTGYALGLVVLGWLARGARGLRAFTRDTLRYRPGDVRWLARLPRAALTGRFPYHDGHFDPGQRIANVVMVLALVALIGSGLGMVYVPWLGAVSFAVHHWAALLATPVLVGHVVVASGVLPGYRGVWRSMHLGGRLPESVAQRMWPGWLGGTARDGGTPGSGQADGGAQAAGGAKNSSAMLSGSRNESPEP